MKGRYSTAYYVLRKLGTMALLVILVRSKSCASAVAKAMADKAAGLPPSPRLRWTSRHRRCPFKAKLQTS